MLPFQSERDLAAHPRLLLPRVAHWQLLLPLLATLTRHADAANAAAVSDAQKSGGGVGGDDDDGGGDAVWKLASTPALEAMVAAFNPAATYMRWCGIHTTLQSCNLLTLTEHFQR